MSDWHNQAEFLLKRGYVSGMNVDQLADKLQANADKPLPEACATRDSVYDEASREFVQKRRDEASEVQKRLISPGERTSAAIETYTPSDQPPLNQNN